MDARVRGEVSRVRKLALVVAVGVAVFLAPDIATAQIAYVTELGNGGRLLRVDLGAGTAVPVASGLSAPHGVLLNATRTTAHVTEETSGELSSIDLSSGTIDLIASGLQGPRGVPRLSQNETAFYLTEADAGTLLRVDIATGAPTSITEFLLSFPFDAVVDAAGAFAYVAETGSGEVSRVELASGNILLIASGLTEPSYLYLSASENTLLVTERLSGEVSRIDIPSGVVTQIASGLGLAAGLAVNESETRAWVVDHVQGEIVEVNLFTGSTNVVLTGLSFPIGIALEGSVCPSGIQVFGQTIRADGPNAISWDTPTDVDYVKGPVEAMQSYLTLVRGTLLNADMLDITRDNPEPGTAVYYLVKNTGSCTSWQTVAAKEAGRDTSILPPCSTILPSVSEIDAAVAAAVSGLSDPWENPGEFQTAYDGIQRALGCAIDDVAATSGAGTATCDTTSYGPSTSYCGRLDSGRSFLTFPLGVGDCLNQACFCLDTCYVDTCITSDPSCSFSSRSGACDTQFFGDASACPSAGAAWPLDHLVQAFASAAASEPNPFYCDSAPCASSGSSCDSGTGICSCDAVLGWWSGDGNANDTLGTHNGTLQGTAAPFAEGVLGLAFQLDGTDDYIEIPDSNDWAFGTSDFTIELWASFDSATSPDIFHPTAFISSDEGGGHTNKWVFGLGGSQVHLAVGLQGMPPEFLAEATLDPELGRWYHLAIVRSGNTFTTYIDGVAAGSESSAVAIPNANFPLTIGQAESIGGVQDFFHHGRLDEVTIYGRALSPAEIASIAARHSGTKCAP